MDKENLSLEEIKRRMLEMGCSKQQLTSKVIPIVYELLTSNPNLIKEYDLERELQKLENEIHFLNIEINNLKAMKEVLNSEVEECKAKTIKEKQLLTANDYYEKTKKMCEDTLNEIKKWENSLTESETPEERDNLRKAQLFIQNVKVDTKYDNTAYIIGLSAILSTGRIAPIEELSKINKKIPTPDDIKEHSIDEYWRAKQSTENKTESVKRYW